MECKICGQDETLAKRAAISVRHGETTILIVGVPSDVCGICGAQSMNQETSAKVEELISSVAQRKEMMVILKFAENFVDEETTIRLNYEAEKILKSRRKFIGMNYPQIRDALKTSYWGQHDWLEFESLRKEIGLCITFGLCQAAVTLTNHFFESLLQYAIIYKNWPDENDTASDLDEDTINDVMSKYLKASAKVMNDDLGHNINKACRLGLIDKKQKLKLHEFKEKFRNAFSHADKDRTFGENEIGVQIASVSDEGKFDPGESKVVQISKMIFYHAYAQEQLCRREAIPYFLYIDSLAREIAAKVLPPIQE